MGIRQRVKTLIPAATLLALPFAVHAQGLTLTPQTKNSGYLFFGLNPQWKIVALIVIRLSLVSMLGISSVVALISVYNWINGEGNEEKIHHNKIRLGNSILMITFIFIMMSIFHYFVPDYHSLAL